MQPAGQSKDPPVRRLDQETSKTRKVGDYQFHTQGKLTLEQPWSE